MLIKLILISTSMLFLVACKDVKVPSAEIVIDRAKSAIAIDAALPENIASEALRKYGAEQLMERAKQGDKKAQYFIAYAYFNGAPGIPRNNEVAYMWLRRAANQGSTTAQLMMGRWWRERIGEGSLKETESAFIRAYLWMSLAEASGNPSARDQLDELINDSREHLERQLIDIAQTLASDWKVCSDKSCWDQEILIPVKN